MRCLLKFVMILLTVTLISQIVYAARWDKNCKIGGYVNYAKDNDSLSWSLAPTVDFNKIDTKYIWVNHFGINYSETSKISTSQKLSIPNNNLNIAERYKRYLTPRTFYDVYSAFTKRLVKDDENTNFTSFKGAELTSSSFAQIGRELNRYWNISTGFQVDKDIVPEGLPAYSWRANLGFARALGYRAKLSWSPVLNVIVPSQTGASTVNKLTSELHFQYVLGKRFSFNLDEITTYISTDPNNVNNTVNMTFSYDLFQY